MRSRCACQQRRPVREWEMGWNLAEKGGKRIYTMVSYPSIPRC